MFFLLRFHTRQAVASDILFSVEQHIQIIFYSTLELLCIYAPHVCSCMRSRKGKKKVFLMKKKELKEKSLYNSVLRLPALRKSTHTIASLDLSWETFFISSSSCFHLMMLFSPVCLFSLSLLYTLLCVLCFQDRLLVDFFCVHIFPTSFLSLLSFLPLFILTYRKICLDIQATLTP